MLRWSFALGPCSDCHSKVLAVPPFGKEFLVDALCLLSQLAKAAGVNQAGLDHFYKVLRVTAQYELCALLFTSLQIGGH